eukprot:m.37578 g.37578  ORF g.37578 m.37578 type:complete len:174 (-) comp5843_c0_seq1:849-1370(-)
MITYDSKNFLGLLLSLRGTVLRAIWLRCVLAALIGFVAAYLHHHDWLDTPDSYFGESGFSNFYSPIGLVLGLLLSFRVNFGATGGRVPAKGWMCLDWLCSNSSTLARQRTTAGKPACRPSASWPAQHALSLALVAPTLAMRLMKKRSQRTRPIWRRLVTSPEMCASSSWGSSR